MRHRSQEPNQVAEGKATLFKACCLYVGGVIFLQHDPKSASVLTLSQVLVSELASSTLFLDPGYSSILSLYTFYVTGKMLSSSSLNLN